MSAVIIFIIILSFLVIIHEIGHFIAARWAKIEVEEFGLGYPPLLKKLFTWRDTAFSLNWIPFGGFVKMKGEEEYSEEDSDEKGSFAAANTIQKLVVILAGASVNFIFGVIAFAIVFSIMGIPQEINDARIAQLAPNSPAAQINLPTNRRITAITVDNSVTEIETTKEAVETIAANRGKTISLKLSGACEQLTCGDSTESYDVYIRNEGETPAGEGALGVAFESVIFTRYPWYEMPFRSMWYGLTQALGLSLLIIQSLGTVITQSFQSGSMPDELAGPVGIVDQASQSGLFEEGALALLSFAGMLSVNLAIMNILPIPPLDGGRALFIILEKLFGRNRTQKLEGFLNQGGYLILLGLIILVTIRDVSRLF